LRVEKALETGNLEEDLFAGDFVDWMKGLLFPPLEDSMEGASGRAPLLGKMRYLWDIRNALRGGAFLYIGAPFGDPRGSTIVGDSEGNE
jgi:hypothetical protein